MITVNKYQVVIIGAGPAGLSAAIECAKTGIKVLVIDENSKPGGQLFKQIHKFFGSREHKAGVRGLNIGYELLQETEKLGIEVWLDSEVCSIDPDKSIWVVKNKEKSEYIMADRIIIATGATENSVQFENWTLPGVMGAGAAQTMINCHRVLPGKKILMIGSGNVGVIVSYQLLQAGAEVAGIIEASPRLGGYGVHTAKVRRAGVPFYTGYTVKQAFGEIQVEAAEIVGLDSNWNFIEGSEKRIEVDTICIAVGLTPLIELVWLAGCRFTYLNQLGGHIPLHNQFMETTAKGIYIAGDVSGIEEASTAMEEGKLAGIGAAYSLGFYNKECAEELVNDAWRRLDLLRCGQFGENRKISKNEILNKREEMQNEGIVKSNRSTNDKRIELLPSIS